MTTNMTSDVAALLIRRGWSVVRSGEGRASLWAYPDAQAEMYLPNELERGSFEWSDIIDRVASANRETASDVELQIELVGTDVMRFRVDSLSSQTIPLEAGATVIASAFGMIRAAATTARRPRQSIGSHYSVVGDAIAREARLAHTEVGSFVFPVLMRVGDPLPEPEPVLDGFAVAHSESEERRVVRTLAQALQSYERHVIQPAKQPRLSDLTPVVVAGGSKEIFAQMSRALTEPGVSWLETGFDWAAKETIAHDVPRRVTIPAEALDIVNATVRLLAQPNRNPARVFTGPITRIGHEPNDPLGRIVIQAPSPTARRLGHIEVTVRAEQLSQIHQWMDTVTTVVVQGEVERVPGRMARLRGVSKPYPLSETMLAVDATDTRA